MGEIMTLDQKKKKKASSHAQITCDEASNCISVFELIRVRNTIGGGILRIMNIGRVVL